MYLFIVSSILIVGFIGINQVTIRKILAYSSINHIGLTLRALAINTTSKLFLNLLFHCHNSCINSKNKKHFLDKSNFLLKK